jgi:hypothetical protein
MRSTRRPKQTTIVPNQDFLDEGELFKKGESYRVDVEKGRYFFRNGWIEGSDNPNPTADPTPVDLQIDKSFLGLRNWFRRSDG